MEATINIQILVTNMLKSGNCDGNVDICIVNFGFKLWHSALAFSFGSCNNPFLDLQSLFKLAHIKGPDGKLSKLSD